MALHADLDHKDIMIMCLVKQYSPLDSFPADGALGHPVSAHLTRAVTAEEDHVLQPVQAHGAHGLLLDVGQLLLQLHHVPLHGPVPRPVVHDLPGDVVHRLARHCHRARAVCHVTNIVLTHVGVTRAHASNSPVRNMVHGVHVDNLPVFIRYKQNNIQVTIM